MCVNMSRNPGAGAYAARARRMMQDRQGMMLDQYALDTVDPAAGLRAGPR